MGRLRLEKWTPCKAQKCMVKGQDTRVYVSSNIPCLSLQVCSYPFLNLLKQPSMVQFTRNKAMNIFMFILLYEPKALHRLVHLILTQIFLPELMTLTVTPMNLMKPVDSVSIAPNLVSPSFPRW